MENKKAVSYLLILLLIILAIRMYFSLSQDYFSSDEAYFHMRHVEYINDNLKPMQYDNLVYAGRDVNYPPFYHYFLAFFTLFMPLALALKISAVLLALLTAFVVYLIAYELTKDNLAALFSSLLASFIPVYIMKTLDSLSIYLLVLPIFFFAIYCLIKLREERTYLVYFVFASILLPFTHPTAFLLLFILIIYSLILLSEDFSIRRPVKEAIIFSILSTVFIQFLIFKQAFLDNGLSILMQNIPVQVANSYVESFNLASAVYSIGILSLLFGSIAILYIVFTSRKDSHLLMLSIILAALSAVLLRFLSPEDGMLFLSFTLAILSSVTFSKLSSYIDVTKFASKKKHIITSIIIISLFLSIIPAIVTAVNQSNDYPEDIDIEALIWIRDNLEGDNIIAALPEEGNLVAYYTEMPVIMDNYYILAKNPEERIMDLERLYQTTSEFEALDITQKYSITVIFVSEKAKAANNIQDIQYATGSKNCFDRRKYDDFAKIYQVRKC